MEENQVQENKSSYGLIYKFLGGDNKDNLSICDGKGEELYNVGKYIFRFTKAGRTKGEIFPLSKMRKFNG